MQDKLGPKAFPLERLLAIFEAILPDDLVYRSQTVDILTLVSPFVMSSRRHVFASSRRCASR